MSNTAWLIVALAIVFIAIGGYTASLLSRSKRSKARLEQLTRTKH
jgi:CcmD family protein